MIFYFSPPEVALLLSNLVLSSSIFLFNAASSLAISRRILGMVSINLVSKTVISLIPFNNTKIMKTQDLTGGLAQAGQPQNPGAGIYPPGMVLNRVLPDAQAVIFSPEKVSEVFNLNSLVQEGFDSFFVG